MLAEVAEPQEEYESFWAEVPDHRWHVEWGGLARKPRHSMRHSHWRLQVGLSVLLCTIVAFSLTSIH